MSPRRGGQTAIVLAIAAGITVGYLAGNVLPSLLDAYAADFGLSAATAGLVATAMLLATAAAGTAFARRATGPGRRRLANVGAVVTAIGFVGCAFASSAVLLTLAAIVAGLGSGVVIATATAALAAASAPDRVSGIGVLINTLVVAILLAGLPMLADSARMWVFLVLALIALLGVPLLSALPDAPVEQAGGAAPNRAAGMYLVAGTAIFAISETGLWAFSQVIGEDVAGMTAENVGLLLAGASFLGLLGAAIPATIGGRFGYAIPVLTLVVVGSLSKVVVAIAPNANAYAIGQLVWGITFPAVFAYLLAMGAGLDGKGRWAVAVGVALAFGGAIGPVLAGLLIDTWGPIALGLAEAAFGLAVFALLLACLRATQRATQPMATAA